MRLSDRLRRDPPEAPPSAAAATDFGRELGPGSFRDDAQPVTRLLFERLGPEVVATIRRRMAETPEIRRMQFERADEDTRRFVELSLGVWFDVEGVVERTRLPRAQPPDEVHAMARGPLAAAGGLEEANLVVSGLQSGGARFEDVRDALDFGCSSGRVVRVLAAAYPEARWRGCDRNLAAIEWARRNLPAIEFFASPPEPPLELAAESLDLAFAISIWSHFEPAVGLRWFEEMRRLLRPGGHLVFTTHGPSSVAHYAANGERADEQLAEISRQLYRRGWWYVDEFGQEGDWGVVDPGWGTTFVTPEWVVTELCPTWRVVEFAPGRLYSNQDVYVLERV